MQKLQGYSQIQSTGARVASATITVYNTGTLTLSQIFSDDLGTPLSNPFTSDANGLWFFYAANGRYDVQMSAGSPAISPAYTLSDYLDLDIGPSVTSIILGSNISLNSAFTSIAPGTTQEQTLPLANALTSGIASVSPTADPGSGLVWSAWISSPNTVNVRLANVSAAPITPNAVGWNVTVTQ